ncbi:MAG: biotin transporter BioY [Clostridia bacterium]|nr:biotin transporter BioY [Clostridia bacterium]
MLDMVICSLSAAMITICSYIAIPFSAIPITAQGFAVCLIAAVFGAKRGVVSVSVYLILGAIGIPVYSGFTGGIGILFGVTGGYFIGFLITALTVGTVSDKSAFRPWQVMLSMIMGTVLCYAFGTLWYTLFYNDGQSVHSVLASCVYPFIIPDLIKIILATVATLRLKPKLLRIIK